MEIAVPLFPNVSKGNAFLPLGATMSLFCTVMITMSVPLILALIPKDANMFLVLSRQTAKIPTIATLLFVSHTLDVSKTNSNVTPLITALWLTVILSGTISLPTLIKIPIHQKPQVADVLTQPVLATKSQFVPALPPWLLV